MINICILCIGLFTWTIKNYQLYKAFPKQNDLVFAESVNVNNDSVIVLYT